VLATSSTVEPLTADATSAETDGLAFGVSVRRAG
jgi:hypothetical protein